MTARERLSYTIKAAVAHALYYAGLLHVLQWVVLRRKAVVLMYHRVLSREERRRIGSHPGLVVDVRTFANHMAVLKRRFAVLTLGDFADRLARRRPFDRPSCMITFDDGWLDNFRNALPVLRAHGLPAVVFLPVNYIGRRRLFAREALTHLLVEAVLQARRDAARTSRLRELLAPAGLGAVLDLVDDDPRQSIVAAVGTRQYMSVPAVESLVSALETELGVRAEELGTGDAFIDWDQAGEMERGGIAFGGHGAEHRVLTQVADEVVETELRASKGMMDSRFPGTVPTFSYPGGGWNPRIAGMVARSGYRLAFTTQTGYVSCEDDPLTLRRLNIHEDVTDSTPMFMARLVGLF